MPNSPVAREGELDSDLIPIEFDFQSYFMPYSIPGTSTEMYRNVVCAFFMFSCVRRSIRNLTLAINYTCAKHAGRTTSQFSSGSAAPKMVQGYTQWLGTWLCLFGQQGGLSGFSLEANMEETHWDGDAHRNPYCTCG